MLALKGLFRVTFLTKYLQSNIKINLLRAQVETNTEYFLKQRTKDNILQHSFKTTWKELEKLEVVIHLNLQHNFRYTYKYTTIQFDAIIVREYRIIIILSFLLIMMI